MDAKELQDLAVTENCQIWLDDLSDIPIVMLNMFDRGVTLSLTIENVSELIEVLTTAQEAFRKTKMN